MLALGTPIALRYYNRAQLFAFEHPMSLLNIGKHRLLCFVLFAFHCQI